MPRRLLLGDEPLLSAAAVITVRLLAEKEQGFLRLAVVQADASLMEPVRGHAAI